MSVLFRAKFRDALKGTPFFDQIPAKGFVKVCYLRPWFTRSVDGRSPAVTSPVAHHHHRVGTSDAKARALSPLPALRFAHDPPPAHLAPQPLAANGLIGCLDYLAGCLPVFCPANSLLVDFQASLISLIWLMITIFLLTCFCTSSYTFLGNGSRFGVKPVWERP
ncbi:MAG: hypothetical protein R3E31_21425 [Chloroflexota bacterium]